MTVEEAALIGGFGSAVMELYEQKGLNNVEVHRIGVPDKFIDHASQPAMRAKLKLDAECIAHQLEHRIPELALARQPQGVVAK